MIRVSLVPCPYNGQRSPAAAEDRTSGRLVQRVLDRLWFHRPGGDVRGSVLVQEIQLIFPIVVFIKPG